jgi:hypothetical protein
LRFDLAQVVPGRYSAFYEPEPLRPTPTLTCPPPHGRHRSCSPFPLTAA